jgi:hypothetical protein
MISFIIVLNTDEVLDPCVCNVGVELIYNIGW